MWVSPNHPDRDKLVGGAAPVESGTRLASLIRGPGEVLRVSLDEFEGHPFISLRVWARGPSGGWFPTRKGVSVRPRELAEVVAALQRAVAELGPLDRQGKPVDIRQDAPAPPRRPVAPPRPATPARPPWDAGGDGDGGIPY